MQDIGAFDLGKPGAFFRAGRMPQAVVADRCLRSIRCVMESYPVSLAEMGQVLYRLPGGARIRAFDLIAYLSVTSGNLSRYSVAQFLGCHESVVRRAAHKVEYWRDTEQGEQVISDLERRWEA